MLNVSRLSADSLKVLKKEYFNYSYNSIYSSYIVPYYEIKKEYRVYYFYNKKQKSI